MASAPEFDFPQFPALEKLGLKPGVIYGEDVLKLFQYAKTNKFAIPAVNVSSSSTVVAVLEAARNASSPIIIQLSNSGSAFWAGKDLPNKKQQASIRGAIAGAYSIRETAECYGIPVVLHTDHCAKKLLPWLDGMLDADEKNFKIENKPLFSSHMIDLSEEDLSTNIETTAAYFKRMSAMSQWLEMEVGLTGGEEDGVNNEHVDKKSLYTMPEDIWAIHQALSAISPYFSIAAAFGNVHGVYHPGNVRLRPELLGDHNAFVAKKLGGDDQKPVFFVFHGGSGSSQEEFRTAIDNGVVKVNLDTDMQFAYMIGPRDYFQAKAEYLKSQVGNPEGPDKPNKKLYDPRNWMREGEVTMRKRTMVALDDFRAAGSLKLEQSE